MTDQTAALEKLEEELPGKEEHPLFLVDGSGFIFRAFHTIPMRIRASDGTPTNAVYGFASMLMKLLADLEAERIAVIFDASAHTFRNELYDLYKANRDEPPEELRPQFALIRDAARAFGLPVIEREGYEADDIIATYCRLARERGEKAVIVSSDKDLMQLVGNGVTMMDPMKNVAIDIEEVIEKFGVPPDKVVDVQALAGDSTDNVPGVPGIGIKTAAQLINEFGDLDTLLERAGEIKQPKRRENLIEHAEMARLSRQLVRLADDVDLDGDGEALEMLKPRLEAGTLIAFLRQMEFPSLVARAENAYGTGEVTAEPAADVANDDEAGYELVTDAGHLEAWIAEATALGKVAVDTETDSLTASRAKLVGISLATKAGRACYIPLGHVGAGGEGRLSFDDTDAAPAQIPSETALGLLKPLLEDPAVLKIGHNFKYDHLILARRGIRVSPVDDTMLMSYVLDGGAHGHGMDELAQRHLGHTTISFKEVAGTGKNQITFDRVPLDKACDYAAEDADVTLKLYQHLKPRLLAERMMTVYETIERPLVAVITEMERAGVKVDAEVLRTMSARFAEDLIRLEGEIHRLAGHPFNVGSPKQLGEVLFDEMGIEGGKKGKTGAYGTGADVLETLAAQGVKIAARVLDWRQIAKLKSTYTDALVEVINPDTGRVHTSFSLAATNTGRLSSNEPNLQNIPIRTEEGRRIRTAFVAEKGHKLLSVDYSQIELRVVADMAGVGALKEAFQEGIDIHAMTASQVFDVPLEEMTPETRRRAKAINFGIIYGISSFGLANQLSIDQKEAGQFIKAYLERFSELKAWMDATKAFAKEHGFVTTLFGRKCHVPGIKDPNPARRGFAERQAINAPIQGTAADIIKRAMVRLPDALAEAGLAARMLLQVHDELLFEVPEAEAEATSALVRQVMEAAATLSVPLVAEAGIGDTWADAH